MKDFEVLTPNMVNAIKQYVFEIRKKNETEFPNALLREDVLNLLNKYCTVIYYPLDDESNNGFHITGIPDLLGQYQQFVFINTSQTMEKQVFTAAHELGHILNVDKYVQEVSDETIRGDMVEHIMNRFAAELLIPSELFFAMYNSEYSKKQEENGDIIVKNLICVIVALMNQFFAPYKAIVLRCAELKIFTPTIAKLLLGEGSISQSVILGAANTIIAENKLKKFQEASKRKWIEGLPELLNQAEKCGNISVEKIKKMRTAFDLSDSFHNSEIEDTLQMKS